MTASSSVLAIARKCVGQGVDDSKKCKTRADLKVISAKLLSERDLELVDCQG